MSGYRTRQAQLFRQLVADRRTALTDRLFLDALAELLRPGGPSSLETLGPPPAARAKTVASHRHAQALGPMRDEAARHAGA